MKIGNLDTRDKVMIVAEIGNNHEGSVELARTASSSKFSVVSSKPFMRLNRSTSLGDTNVSVLKV